MQFDARVSNSARSEAPASPATLAALLPRQAALRPHTVAYCMLNDELEVAQSLTFGALAAGTPQLARALLQHAQPGDRVLLAFNNGLACIEAFWACIAAGLIPIPAPAPDTRHSRVALTRLTAIAANAEIALALTADDSIEEARVQAAGLPWYSLAELRAAAPAADGWKAPQVQADAVAYLQYTSGSTSEPRGVMLTHDCVLAQCHALASSLTVDLERDRSLIWLPWFHDYGLIHALIQPMYAGAPSFMMPTLGFMRHPLRWLSAIDTHRITHTGAPNFAYAACVQALARNSTWAGRLDTLRVASCGAEPVRRDTLEAFTAAFAPHGFAAGAFAPSYGLAEAVLVVTLTASGKGPRYLQLQSGALEQNRAVAAKTASARAIELVSCGTPLPGFELKIVDPQTRVPCEPEGVGEIWVSGPSVGRGYWRNPEATAAAFGAQLADEGDEGHRYLRTGDLGFVQQGELFVTGRRKDLLVVHGRNVYPQDLERTAELAHAAVREAGVIAIGITRADGKETAALLVECRARPAPEVISELIETVRLRVATDHEIDVAEVVPLRSGSLPRTSSGKPQRSAARQMYLDGELESRRLAAHAVSAAPASDDAVSLRLRAIWAEVLGVTEPAADADFFAQGGDSLLATQIVSRLNESLGIDLPVRAVFEAPTLSGLAQLARNATPHAHASMVTARDPQLPRPLSFAQERMWFMHELAPDSPAYNIPLAVQLRGPLDLAALQQAVDQVVNRHHILRTGFSATPRGPRARLQTGVAAPRISEIDLRAGHANPLPAAQGLLAGLASRPFRLDDPALLRISVIRLADDRAILLWVMHHIVGDQWSCAVLGRELAACYGAALSGEAAALPELPMQYADYADWHRQWFSGARRQQQLDYWRRQLQGVEALNLNTDFPRLRQQGFSGAAVRRPLDQARIKVLTGIAAAQGASLSMVLIAALKILLFRHSGATDIAIGVPIANRHKLATENLIGTFVNTLVFRTDLSGGVDFSEVVRRVREVALGAFTHQDMPFEVLVRELNLPHDLSRSPLFDVMFNMVNTPARDLVFPGLEWSRFDFDRGAAQYDLAVSVDALYDHAVVFEYATDLFAADTIERLADHYLRILDAAIEAAQCPVMDIPLLGDAEHTVLRQWGKGPALATVSQPPDVSDLLHAAVSQHVAAPALVFRDMVMSYGELDAAANRLAAELRQRGLGRGQTVGLCLPRTSQLLIAVLGVLKSGAAYVPLDPAYPRDRLLWQAQDAGIDLLLADTVTAGYLKWSETRTLLVDRDADVIAAWPGTPLRPDADRDAGAADPAYVIYTSGSTGTPKGVRVPHRAVVNFLCSMRVEPGLAAGDRWLAVTTLGFDIAVLELLLPLSVGACVVLASDTEAADGQALAGLLERHAITVMQATASRWHLLLGTGWQGRQNLTALVGGEPLEPQLAGQLLSRCAALWNMYGPTETTVWSTCGRVINAGHAPIPLGRPVVNTTVQILDEHGHPSPIGVAGEICIGGLGLALDYLNQPALTASQFVTASAEAVFPAVRIYRTGDRGRWTHAGSLEHLGRFDQQLKLRGYRIEPGEIEAHLCRHAAVSRAVVVRTGELSGDSHLVAYFVATGAAPDADDCRAHLRQWLPEHMIPRHFVALPSIPLLPNGKLNRRALPTPAAVTVARRATEPPKTAMEHALMRIWQKVLQSEDFGIEDNFFDIGGHSILAVNTVQQITQTLGVNCPLPLIFHHPTVASLAAALEAAIANSGRRDGTVVELLSGGAFPALFCLAGTHLYRDLAAHVTAHVRVYGLLSEQEIQLLDQGSELPDVVELATAYLAAIRRLQPVGPYRLAGFSMGGAIAWEVAQQIRASGDEVELLALIDTAAPGMGYRHVWRWIKKRFLQLRRHGFAYVRQATQRLREQGSAGSDTGAQLYPEYARIMRRYRPHRWDGDVLFLQAAGDPIKEAGYGWKQWAPALRVETVPGEHMDILRAGEAIHAALHLNREFDKSWRS